MDYYHETKSGIESSILCKGNNLVNKKELGRELFKIR